MAKEKRGIRENTLIGDILIYAVVAILCFITLYPMYYVLVTSLSDPLHASTLDVYFWPKSKSGIYLGAYKKLITDSDMWNAYKMSALYTLVPTFFMLVTSATCAYPLTSPKLKGRRIVSFYLLIPLYFSGGLIPSFLLMTQLHLYNNIWAILIPASFNVWYIILTRTYFSSIPEELREAARIDGANNYQCLFRLYLPNAKPILAVIAIYTLVGRWNSWYDALIYLPRKDLQPLQLYLRRLLVDKTVDLSAALPLKEATELAMQQLSNDQMKFAMIIFTTLPMIFAYPFLQRYFVKGVMIGSLKG